MDDNDYGVDVLRVHVAGLLTPLQSLAALSDSTAAAVLPYLNDANALAVDVHKMPWLRQFLWSKRITQQLQLVGNNLQSAVQSISLHLQLDQQLQKEKEMQGQQLGWQERQEQQQVQEQQQQQQALTQQLVEMQLNQQLLLHQNQQLLLQRRGVDAASDEPAHALAVVSSMMEARGLGIRQARVDIDAAMGHEGCRQEDREVSQSNVLLRMAYHVGCTQCRDAVCVAGIAAIRTPPV
jgi:polyhomeotic-like protein 1